ncbi:hypothetical protein E1181_09270 [Saccharopolyspora terrae]|uniref:DUF1440 domain-containing protein n=1 Tax=Saccharopolyspora terrae TaxID=2530384 RepID=A0A4R4W3L4_9PSEU|nr:hypothetical protein [Saccharopolyspora terrae]TDD07600.1 hypothetical protein E1181_09270 [Saccharopolyspora terrae]
MTHLLRGLAAGAAGTTALNTATFLDMVLRGRPASSTPEETVRSAERIANTSLGSEAAQSAGENRRTGVGALLGIGSGLGAGLLHALLRHRLPHAPGPLLALATAAAANAISVVPMTALDVTQPRSWPASSWASDLIPHLVFGAVTAATYDLLGPRSGH